MKIAAITGGGAGLGRGIAWHSAELGYGVSILNGDAVAGRESATHVRRMGAQAHFVKGDVSRAGDVDRWLRRTQARFGGPDVLVNNAGIMIRKDVFALKPEEFDTVIAVNLRDTFLCSQAVARMISPGWIEVGDWQKASKAKTPRSSRADREQNPAGRVGTPDDVTRACHFLAEDASFMTGQNFVVDGGMGVKMIYV